MPCISTTSSFVDGGFQMPQNLGLKKVQVHGSHWGLPGTMRLNYPTPVKMSTTKHTVKKPLAIEVQNLNLSIMGYNGQTSILNNCSLTIPEGKFWMLLGPNGCGKSTLLKAMAGLLKPNSGYMRVATPKSFVFQNPDYQVVMPTVEADVAFGLGSSNLLEHEVRERVKRSLLAVGMEAYLQRAIQTLSGGQKQRVAIAGALAEFSQLLLLDELTTFLDGKDQVAVLEAVRNVILMTPSITALWVTHRFEELDYADGAAYMENGSIAFSGSISEVKLFLRKRIPKYS